MQNTKVITQFYFNNMLTFCTIHNSNYYIYSCLIAPSSYYNIIMVVITTRCDVYDIQFEINTWLLFVILLFFLMKNTKSTFEPQELFFYYPPAGGRSGFEPGLDRPNSLEQTASVQTASVT